MRGLGATTTTTASKRFSAGLVWVLSLFLPPSFNLTLPHLFPFSLPCLYLRFQFYLRPSATFFSVACNSDNDDNNGYRLTVFRQ